jgi:hypothetical protein
MKKKKENKNGVLMGEKLIYLLHSIRSSLVTQDFAPFANSSLNLY